MQHVVFKKAFMYAFSKIIRTVEKIYQRIGVDMANNRGFLPTACILAFCFFALLPWLVLGNVSLLFIPLIVHNLCVYNFENNPECKYSFFPNHNRLFYRLIRKYCKSFPELRFYLKRFINEEKLFEVVYGEQELREKKNQ